MRPETAEAKFDVLLEKFERCLARGNSLQDEKGRAEANAEGETLALEIKELVKETGECGDPAFLKMCARLDALREALLEKPDAPTSFEERKAQVEKLVGLFVFYTQLLSRTQLEIGLKIGELAKEHGAEAFPILDDAIKRMRAATLQYQETASPLKM